MAQKIIRNAARCKACGDVIESYDVHDFVKCGCGKIFVDGGHEYLRRGFVTSEEVDMEDLSVVVEV